MHYGSSLRYLLKRTTVDRLIFQCVLYSVTVLIREYIFNEQSAQSIYILSLAKMCHITSTMTVYVVA